MVTLKSRSIAMHVAYMFDPFAKKYVQKYNGTHAIGGVVSGVPSR